MSDTPEQIEAARVLLDQVFTALKWSPRSTISELFECACVGPIPECKCMRLHRLAREFVKGEQKIGVTEKQFRLVPNYTVSSCIACPHRSKGFLSEPDTCIHGDRKQTPYSFGCDLKKIPDHCPLPENPAGRDAERKITCQELLANNR